MVSFAAVPAGREALKDALREAHAHLSAGRLEQAERGYRAILRANGRQAEALNGLGLVALKVNNRVEAARLMRAAIGVDLRSEVYRTNLGNVLQMEGMLAEAAEEYERALQLRPDSAAALSNLGTALLGLGRAEAAVERLERAAALRPDSGQVWDNLGNALQAVGRLEEAVACHERALEISPERAEVCGNLGLALAGLGRWEAAAGRFELGLTIDPGNARIQLARAQLQLLLGDFERGWANYEWRKRVHGERKLAGRAWGGEPLAPGESLLLYAEQGLGDTVQALRYVAEAAARIGPGAGLIVEVQAPLRRLAETMAGRVVGFGEELPPFDWHCALLSLPLALRCPPAGALAGERGYLRVPEGARAAVARRWEAARRLAGGAKLAVGLVWAGNRKHARDRFRSMPRAELAPLLAIDGVAFHSLQLEPREGESAEGTIDWSGVVGDMADTAAVVERLDLVIGVDTAVVHLAGALGKQVWTMLPFWPDWRWGLEREDTAWYPGMRLFRQQRRGDWAGVVERVRVAVLEKMGRIEG